jgi:hypothetical protein
VPSPPTIDYERTCGAYIPSLGPTEVTFVEGKPVQTPKGRMIAHRFRANQACGFDAVISLPDLTFTADASPYELRVWWMNANGAVSILAGLLLRPSSDAVLLAASPSAVDRINALATPLALTLSGSACPDDAGGLLEQILTRDTNPLSCTDEAGSPALRRCTDGARTYRMVAYAGTLDDPMPGLFGAAELLAPPP